VLASGAVIPCVYRWRHTGGAFECNDGALKSYDGTVLELWDGAALSHLPAPAISNEFAYNVAVRAE
jgi:hypothetical protein